MKTRSWILLLSALALLVGVVVTLCWNVETMTLPTLLPAIAVGGLAGGWMAVRVKMIQMPQTVALFNGLGGGASALVGMLSAQGIGFSDSQLAEISGNGYWPFVYFTALLAVAVGTITLVGSLVAAGKLHRLLPQKPVLWPMHSLCTLVWLLLTVAFIIVGTIGGESCMVSCLAGTLVSSALFGLWFSVRVGGADMPITISLLNSLSGVAGSIAGMAISDVFLVAVGGIVGASGLLLTQIMCRAMNRSLLSILLGGAHKAQARKEQSAPLSQAKEDNENEALIKRVMDLEKKIKELEEIVKNLEGRVKVLNEKIDEAIQRDGIPYNIYIQRGLLEPSGDNFVDYHDCFNWFRSLIEDFEIYPLMVGYDRYSAQYLIQDLSAYGFQTDSVYQGDNLWGVLQEMEGLFKDGIVHIGDNDLLKIHLLNSAIKMSVERGRGKLIKLNPSAHIDGVAALTDAFCVRQKWWNEMSGRLINEE